MILLPPGKPIYENLNTSFTQFDALMNDLKSTQLSGYVRVTAWEYEGLILMDNGTSVSAIEETPTGKRTGVAAAEAIAAKAKEKDGTINVARLESELATLLGGLAQGESLYKDLSSDFTSLDKLIAKLKSEAHSGYIEIRFGSGADAATIYLQEGEPIECAWLNGGTLVASTTHIAQITQLASQRKATFNVYRADLARAYGNQGNLADSFARQATLQTWQQVFQTIETVTDPGGKTEHFRTAFKRASIEHATAYAFLDPFAGEFEYRAGQITFTGSASITDFNEGICKVTASAVQKVGTQNKVRAQLAATLTQLHAQSGQRLEDIGLVAALPELFGG